MQDRFSHPQNQTACYNITTLLSYNCCCLVSHRFISVWDVIRHQWKQRFSSRDCEKKFTFPWKFIVSTHVTIKIKCENFFSFLGLTVFFYKLIFWLVYKSKIGMHFILLTSMKNQAWEIFFLLGLTEFFTNLFFDLSTKAKLVFISYFWLAWKIRCGKFFPFWVSLYFFTKIFLTCLQKQNWYSSPTLASMEKCFHFSFHFLLITTRIYYIIINFPWNYFKSKNERRKISHQPESNHEPLV